MPRHNKPQCSFDCLSYFALINFTPNSIWNKSQQ
ncbi:hypothetical protein CF65_02906 [Aggregatibacter actinomycetemcomitans HK1651]|nr:hypothetical protein CF65_02906 [Aggregatibacter actinomycetemcomitans HK1651]